MLPRGFCLGGGSGIGWRPRDRIGASMSGISAKEIGAIAVMAVLAGGPALANGWPVGDAEHGEKIAQRWCSSCHLLPGATSGSDTVPSFHAIATAKDFDAGHVRVFLAKPHGGMPPVNLSRQDINDVVAYLQLLRQQ